MVKLGNYRIWLSGSCKHISRVVYKDEVGGTFIKFYGDFIEVLCGTHSYFTVEKY